MDKNRYDYVCTQTEQGRDAFVKHPESGEEGRVLNCSDEKVEGETVSGQQRTWNYREVEEIARSKEEWPRRD